MDTAIKNLNCRRPEGFGTIPSVGRMKTIQRFRILPVRGKFHIYEVSGPVPMLVAYRTTPERAAENCRRWNMVARAYCDQGFGNPFMTQDIATINRTLIDKYETLLSQLSRLQAKDCAADYIRGQLNGLAFALDVTGYSGHLPKGTRANLQTSRAERSGAQIAG